MGRRDRGAKEEGRGSVAQIERGGVCCCADEDGCGIEVTVTKVCGCVDECDLIGCGKQMKRKNVSSSSEGTSGDS